MGEETIVGARGTGGEIEYCVFVCPGAATTRDTPPSFAGRLAGHGRDPDKNNEPRLFSVGPRFGFRFGESGQGNIGYQQRWLTGGSFAALTAFNRFYTIGDIAVFYIPSYLIACTWIGVATAWLASLIRKPIPSPLPPSGLLEEQPISKQTTPVSSENPSGLPSSGLPSSGLSPSSLSPFVVLPFVVIFLLLLLPAYLFISHAAPLDRSQDARAREWWDAVSYTHLRAHDTVLDLVCRLLLEHTKPYDHTHTLFSMIEPHRQYPLDTALHLHQHTPNK